MAVNPDKNIVEQSLIARLIGKIKRIALDISDDVSAEETRAMAAEAAAKTVVTAGENCSVTKTTASDGHDVYTINADGKPQVQADWNQADSSKVDYIKNKLKLSNAIDSTSTTEAATPKAVKDAYDELNNKIVARAVFLSQQEWAAQSLLPGDPAKVYYVEDGTGEDAYTVYVWKSSTSAYVEVDELSIDLDGYWHDGPSSSGTGNVVTGMSLGNDGVPVLEKNLTAATLDSNGTVPLSQIPDSVKDKIVFIDGTIVSSEGSYRVYCDTTYAQVAAMVDPYVGKYPICRFTLGSQIYYFMFHVGVVPPSSHPRYTFGSTDVYSVSNTVSFMTSVYVEPDDVWRFREIEYDPTSWNNALDGKQNTISDLSTIRSGASAGASALQPSGDGSNLSVTPDGSSTGYDLGNSTTLKSFAQKFKNLVGSLKALAFKDTADKTDLSQAVQTSLGKADTALQPSDVASSVTSGDTTHVPTSAAVYDFVVPVRSIDLSNATTDLVTEIKNRVGSNVGYLRFVCKGDGASANITNKPISQNNSFYCEVWQVSYQSATDYRYRLRFESGNYGAYAAELIPSYTTLTWYRMIKQYNHQSTTDDYGAADATHYGHTMLTNTIDSTTTKAVTPSGVNSYAAGRVQHVLKPLALTGSGTWVHVFDLYDGSSGGHKSFAVYVELFIRTKPAIKMNIRFKHSYELDVIQAESNVVSSNFGYRINNNKFEMWVNRSDAAFGIFGYSEVPQVGGATPILEWIGSCQSDAPSSPLTSFTKMYLNPSDLSTSIADDSASNAKAATPKAVYDWTGGYKISVNPGGTPGSAANTLYFV